MMYKNLLLSSQGGIINKMNRAKQDNCAVVAIGLGGTGVSCLKNLKQKIYNRVIPDNQDPNSDVPPAVPEYKHIKFLAVDSDKNGLAEVNRDSSSIDKVNESEYFDISYKGDISEVFERNKGMLDTDSAYREWLEHSKIKVLSAKDGACGIRQIGRYLFMQRASAFVNKVRELVVDAKKDLNEPNVYVHIFSGIGGGTGAGTFLDACYLIQKALNAAGVNAHTCGYFFLPDVNLDKVTDEETRSNIKENGFACLQELDYCMNFENNKDEWCQRYPGIGEIRTYKPPVDICHLISGRDTSGNNITNAYDYAMNVVTDYFMDFLVKTGAQFTMASHIANYTAKKSQLNKTSGAQYEYCVLGASNASLPYKEILTYLASRLFDNFEPMKTRHPSAPEVETFIKKNSLTYEALFNMLIRGVDMSFPLPDVKPADAKENDDLTTTYFADLRAKAIAAADKNFSTMTRDIEKYDVVSSVNAPKEATTTASSIITKVFKLLVEMAADNEKGPYYTSELLKGTSNNDIVSYIDGHITEVSSKISQLEYNLPDKERRRKLDQDNFFGHNRASRSRYNAYVSSSRELAMQYAQQQILYTMKDFLEKLRKQLIDLSSKYFRVYCSVISNIDDTFRANKTYIEDLRDDVKEFEYPIAKINEIKNVIDKQFEKDGKFNIDSMMHEFQIYLLSEEGHNAWAGQVEGDICKYISSYFTKVFSEYTEKTMTGYLKDKYGTENTEELINAIRNDIMEELNRKANPLFHTSHLYDASKASPIGYVSIPDDCSEVEVAAENLVSVVNTLQLRKTSVKDRITIMRCFVGAPIYGYSQLADYEVMSMNTNKSGKHLYEGKTYIEDSKEFKGRDWRFLPSPTPLSLMNSSNDKTLRDRAKHAADVYDAAVDKGIIYQPSTNDYEVRFIDKDFFNEMITLAEEAKNKKDPSAMYAASEKIKEMKDSLEFERVKISIPNDCKNGDGAPIESEKKKVRVDHFAFMPKVVEMVEEEIAKYEKIDELINALIPKADTDFEDYTNALFTGAITIEGVKIYYVDDFADKVDLSAPTMQMGAIRLYQAYVNFKALDETVREKLKAISEKRNSLSEGMDIIIESCTNVKTQLNPQMKAMQLNLAKNKFPQQAIDIRDFFVKFESAFDLYLMNYGIML